ncbi:S8 family serine peptidase [Dokdonella sp.]|uniref:S8 family serine peptidase n=1 Tax=Dokdonella sp. TaxID=2291710 RepID=UPI003C426F95
MRKFCLLALSISVACPAVLPAMAESWVVPAGIPAPASFRLIADYGSYRLFEGSPALAPSTAWPLADAHLLKLDRLTIDTRLPSFTAPQGFRLAEPSRAALQLVQFTGPVKDAWLDQLRVAGATPIQYIDSNGYLVWADAGARSKLDTLAQAGQILQYSTPLPGFIKLGNSLFDRMNDGSPGDAKVEIVIQRYRHAEDAASRQRFTDMGLKPVLDWSPQLDYEIARFDASLAQVREIIEWSDVFWVGEYFEPALDDEVQAQIIRGHLTADQSEPLQSGYLPWLQALGFPADPQAYPVLDITDSGIGNRTVLSGDPTLNVAGESGGATRLVYNQACTVQNGPVDGHGHLNANIAAGFDLRDNGSTPGARFPGEYQRGLGMNPFGRLGGTRLFAPGFDQNACGGTYTGVIEASYAAGARISNNSWGCGACAGQYDISSQAYDAGTRDADSGSAGNQQLITIFSAGNNGSGSSTVGTPANGKNMITVGAAENPRPQDENGAWVDGCQIGPSGADDAMDVIFFSSRGPAPGNRIKPELIAPGTHVTGTQANPVGPPGICDATRPLGNATYAASSGTSHSAPAVSGVASLAWWWIANARGSLEYDSGVPSEPSPALMKAWLVSHPTYLTGEGANDNLPSNAQGFGMPDLEDMFSSTPHFIVNQDHMLGASGEVWSWQGEVVDSVKPLRVVLAWTDAPGAVGTSPQVNNLDLEIRIGTRLYRGNQLNGQWSYADGLPDTRNNVEVIYLPAGSTGPFTITVRGLNIAGDGVPGNADPTDQDFALVCNNCASSSGFVLDVQPAAQEVCTATANSATVAITTEPILGFGQAVSLTSDGAPIGATTVFATNPMPVPGSNALTIGNLAGTVPGNYSLKLVASGGGVTRARSTQLDLSNAGPSAFDLTAPASGAVNQDRQPLLSWTPASQARRYRIEIASDASFGNVVYSFLSNTSSHNVGAPLDYSTTYYWRVTAINACGETSATAISSFTTVPLPGECSTGTLASALYATDFESGAAGWSHSGDHDTWALSTARAHGGVQSFLAQDLAYDSDQLLVSPGMNLPADELPLSLQFWSHQTIENRVAGCYDGALLDISVDDGATWTQVPDGRLLVGGYDGPISTSFNNPARGRQAWCGDPRDWSRTIVDLNAYAGQSVRFRFRVATDASTGRVPDGFYLDDVVVQTCAAAGDPIFVDGFDSAPPP